MLLLGGCGSPAAPSTAAPVAPFEASRLCRGTYSSDQLEAWFKTASPTVLAIHGAVFLDNDELVHCLRVGVEDRVAGEAAELALEGLAIPRDAAIIEFAEAPRFLGD
jgi:hypothetical protein